MLERIGGMNNSNKRKSQSKEEWWVQGFSATIPRFSGDPLLTASYLALSTRVGYLYSEMEIEV